MKKVLLSAIFMAFVTCVFAQSVTLPNPEPNWLNKHLLNGDINQPGAQLAEQTPFERHPHRAG